VRCGNGGWKTELLTIIQACESYATTFDKPPETSYDKTYVLVELKHPIELTSREALTAIPTSSLTVTAIR
jgi:hypothetical protein